MTQGASHGRPEYTLGMEADLDPQLQHEIDDALGKASLLDLAEPPPPESRRRDEGLRRGRVAAVQADEILVDMGGKSTGILPRKQWGEEPLPAVGDIIDVMVIGYDEDEGLMQLSRQDAVMAATWESLQVGQTVEGRVTGMNKGGLELKIDGIAAFMPMSQIERFRVDGDVSLYINQRMTCRVEEIRRRERKLVVSRRAVLMQQAAEARETLFSSLTEGQQVRGTVKSIMPYGAFVDIGGVDGLLHVGDMSHSRVADPRTVVKEGQELTLQVLKIDHEKKKIGLGLKQIMADPWEGAPAKWPAETLAKGRVTRLLDFGAFVELEPGVEGLIPISELSFERRIGHPREVVKEGDVIEARVLSVDVSRKRISLSMKRVGQDPWMGASLRWPADSAVSGTVKSITDFGAFVELAPGVEGLVHISELSNGRVNSVGEAVKAGQVIQAKVLAVDEDKRRISLSIKKLTTVPQMDDSTASVPAPQKHKPKRKKPLRGGLER